MNAKELREAAQRLIEYPEANPDDVTGLADYILATVRDDDDEPVAWEWLAERMTLLPDDCDVVERLASGPMYVHRFHGPLTYVVSCVKNDGEHAAVNPPESRGQFRSLCRGLSIDLKEGGQ